MIFVVCAPVVIENTVWKSLCANHFSLLMIGKVKLSVRYSHSCSRVHVPGKFFFFFLLSSSWMPLKNSQPVASVLYGSPPLHLVNRLDFAG